jgi:hypothetical protein
MKILPIERFPNGWCIRRRDGSIATIQAVKKGVSEAGALRAAELLAKEIDLSPLPPHQHRKAKLDRLPKVQFNLRHRYRGADFSENQQWSIYLSFQLPLCSIGSGAARKMRWSKSTVGELANMTEANIEAAWREVYGKWAWATHLKADLTPEQLFDRRPPDDTSEFLALIAVPAAPTIDEIWDRLGYIPKIGTDAVARKKKLAMILPLSPGM